MNAKRLAVWTTVSILGWGLLGGCSQPNTPTPTDVSPEPQATDSPAPSDATASPEASSELDAAPESASGSDQVFFEDNGVALRGYDPVAYFQDGQPVAGNEAFRYEWANVTWYFSSAENRDRFASQPEQYAPQYGGFCAWAVSQGYTAPIDPTAWRIVDGKLYLNFNQSVQRQWEADIPGHIASGDRNWPGIQTELISQR